MNVQTCAVDFNEWKRRKELPLPVPTVFDFAGYNLDIQDGERVTVTYHNRHWCGIFIKRGDGWRFIEDVE